MLSGLTSLTAPIPEQYIVGNFLFVPPPPHTSEQWPKTRLIGGFPPPI